MVPRIKLIDEWWTVLWRSWSSRLALASGALGAIDFFLSLLTPWFEQRTPWFRVGAGVFAFLSWWSRVIKQQTLEEAVAKKKQDKDGDAEQQ